MKKKFTLLIVSVALLLGSGGMAWGQINYTAPNSSSSYPDCDNNYGAGESAIIIANTMSVGNGKITIGGVANIVGHYSSGGNTQGYHTTSNTAIYTAGTSSCNGSSPSTAYMPDLTNYCGTLGTDWRFESGSPAFTKVTTVEIAAGYSLGTPLVLQQYYFLDIPWYYRTYFLDTYSASAGSCPGPTPDTRPVARVTETTIPANRGGYVDGLVIVHSGSNVRLTSNAQSDYGIGAGNHTNSKATVTFPIPASFTNYSYSVMIDGTFRENTLLTGAGGVANNISPLAEHAVFGINAGYYPGTKISTHQAGGTILIGNNTQGQDKMEITTTTGTGAPAGGFTSSTVYTGTDLGVIGTGNLGNYGSNAMTVAYSTSLFGPTSNNVGTSAMQIYNHSCNPLTFNNQPFVININAAGYLLVEGYENVNFNSSQRLTATNTGRTIINGGNVNINAYHDFIGSSAPATAADMYYSVNAYKNGQPGWNGNTYCGNGDITTGTSAVVNVKNSGNGHSKWYADRNITTGDGVYFTNAATGQGTTFWNAVNSIFTKDTVIFDHSATTNMMANGNWITLKADTGNILMDKKVNFLMANDSSINILAENITGTLNTGNISFFDSTAILRTNTGTPVGKTNILAGRNIYTAMFTFESKNPNGDNTNVISHMGDIWLGYNNNLATPALGSLGQTPTTPHTALSYDLNRFVYNIPVVTTGGKLLLRSGDKDPSETVQSNGGNIYFTHIVENLAKNGLYNTEVSIPFSNFYNCNQAWNTSADYEMAGIIGGVARCQLASPPWNSPWLCSDTGLIYRGFDGQLLFDAGTRGNIIINNGSYLTFQNGKGNTEFRTRWGDIDMRYPFDVDSMQGGLLYLASSDLPNKLKTSNCSCEEKRNNIYLQDFKYNPVVNSGSVFIGADNNIKLQYGGLKGSAWNMNQRDPFFSGKAGYPCGTDYHCDSDTSENQARDLILNFAADAGGASIAKGGFAAVASDLIDVYKNMEYKGGQGAGMSSVPGYGSLHGESVAGFGLYIKTQANKSNWDHSAFDLNVTACWPPKCDDPCTNSILQNVARVTFHSDARIGAENQRVYIGSPVLETYGNLDLNTHDNKGGKTSITIQTDSLIVHDSLIIDGKLTKFTTWSGLYRDMPIIKLGHQRFTPPFVEDSTTCAPCFIHQKGTGTFAKRTALDTLYVTYRNGASIPRLHTLVADHTVLSFLTDSFDHVQGDPTLNAKFYTDTFKVRNHVELYTDPKHERDGHFELISEAQMSSKDYAGIYARHLHMEPAAPSCDADFPYSQLWMPDPALDVITTSTFGGYGWIHADVHVEIEAILAPGYASLRTKGDYCHELKAGTLKMKDLRLDKGAEIRYSIGHEPGFDGEKADCIDVDEITMYGSVFLTVEKRCGQQFEEGCYPIIRYKSVAVDTVNLNNLTLATKKIDGYKLSLDTSIPGVVYLCVGEGGLPQITREVYIPQTPGVTTTPNYGKNYVASQDNFKFTAKYTTPQPLKVVTDRLVDGKEEELTGKLNANGEYEYVIRRVTQNIVLKFGPDYATDNISIDGRAVWSHNNTIYIRVEATDIASIYSIAGQLVKRIDLTGGSTSVPMERGVYIVTLKDGSVHKVIVQ